MSAGHWLREAQSDLAVERILEAAGAAFAALGVDGARMADVARHAGCSRGTLYRYFPTREALHIAFVADRARAVAAEVAARVADEADTDERLVRTILESLRAVRARPALAVWFEAGQAGHTARLAGRPELLDALARGFAASLADGVDGVGRVDTLDGADGASAVDGAGATDAAAGRAPAATRFIVRIVVSLLATPGPDAADEEEMVRRFVVPGLRAGGASVERCREDCS